MFVFATANSAGCSNPKLHYYRVTAFDSVQGMRRLNRRSLLLIVVTTLLVTAPVTAASDASHDRQSITPSMGETPRLYQADDRSNNTSVPHENPEEIERENRLDRLASYLSGDLNQRIGESSVRLSQEEYDAASSLLGDDYSDSLGKYVDVDGETGGDGAAEEYDTVQSTQREYTDTVREFRETQREYEDARQAGDDDRARELARELARLATEGESQSDRLVDLYGQISNRTGGDLSESRARITEIQSDLSEQRDEIVAREFIETRFIVRSATRNISFTDPLVIAGTLETANGTPVDIEQARFAVGQQVIRTAIAPDGTFEFAYRPTVIDATTTSLSVTYRPPGPSVYRGSSETVAVDVTQVTATATASTSSGSAYGYADPVAVEATVEINGTPIVNYPLAASLAGRSLSTGRTNGSGRSTLAGTVPAAAPVGDADFRVRGDRENRAVRLQPTTVSVSIESTTTELTADARADVGGTVVVEGRLLTDDGDGVGGQRVAVAVDGRPIGTTTTGASGQYRTTIDPPPNVSVDNATAVVTFDGSGTNLESVDASTEIVVTDSPEQGVADSDSSSTNQLLDGTSLPGLSDLIWVGLTIAILVIAVVVVLRRRSDETDPDTTGTIETADTGAAGSDPSEVETDVSASAFQSATQALSEGEANDAVVTAYTGVRDALGKQVDVKMSATHWEFYRQCLDQGIEQAEPLESLTMGYEKAAYSGLTMSDDDAEAALETARLLLDAIDPQ